MTIKVLRVDGNTDIFETDKFLISTKKDLHPAILKATVYSGGRKIGQIQRHFKAFYKRFVYKPTETELHQEEAPKA